MCGYPLDNISLAIHQMEGLMVKHMLGVMNVEVLLLQPFELAPLEPCEKHTLNVLGLEMFPLGNFRMYPMNF